MRTDRVLSRAIGFAAIIATALLVAGLNVPTAYAQSPRSAFDHTSPPSFGSISRTSLVVGIGLGTAALVGKQHEDADAMSRRLDRSGADGLLDFADLWGAGTTMGLTAAGLLALGETTGKGSCSDAGKDLTTSLLMTWTAVWGLKVSINAKRPNGGSYSFPSGHTATAFAAAPVLSRHFGPLVGFPAYGMAVFTGLARMEERRHYLSDVLVGAAIGFVVGREVAAREGSRWVLTPFDSGIGISLRF